MSPQRIGITTTYKTRVATLKPCKKRQRILIGQSKDRRVSNLFHAGPVRSLGKGGLVQRRTRRPSEKN
jgi:hypothetical protein